ncbi:fatty acid desaturase family protein [Bradyrhizobium ottawaense]|uniref:fatty acid desaturase family protein n=1 Tax=Bradyrhizobium ottawaense TaxID=931866 RepID=UPI003834506F
MNFPNVTTTSSSAASLRRGLAIVTTYAALGALACGLWPSGWVAVPLLCGSFILSGSLNAAHDCVHATHVGKGRLNRVVGAAWCTVILINFTIYRHQHLVHHRFPGVEGDSEGHANLHTVADYVHAQSGLGFWCAIFRRMILTWRGQFPPSINSKKFARSAQIDNLVILSWLSIAGLLTIFWPIQLVICYWMPLLFYPMFALFFSLPEHLDLTRIDVMWPRARNVTSNVLVRFFQWNANYHALHHRQPALPACSLHRVYCDGDNLRDPAEKSYLRFHAQLIARLWRSSPPVV